MLVQQDLVLVMVVQQDLWVVVVEPLRWFVVQFLFFLVARHRHPLPDVRLEPCVSLPEKMVVSIYDEQFYWIEK